MYPLQFDPIFQYRLWGGRRLANLLSADLPEGPVGEAWMLSDRDDHTSHVASGEFRGRTIEQLIERFPEDMLGSLSGRFKRFPLLLKFLDAKETLSVQVHPDGKDGKTEAWVVLESGAKSRVYAGLTDGTTEDVLRGAMDDDKVPEHLASFHPSAGDAVFIPGGTVHCLGGNVTVFEIQQNNDVTYRLYDWGHIDPRTGKHRPLQTDLALGAIDYTECDGGLVRPVEEDAAPLDREKLFDCDYFRLNRLRGDSPFLVGASGVPTVLVCIAGAGQIEYDSDSYPVRQGNVFLMPASIGTCTCLPDSSAITVLEIAIPE
jgi:mannose-6-phosphate isomerase